MEEKRALLLNYFVKKLTDYMQQELKHPNYHTAALSLITAKVGKYYRFKPNYVQSLLFLLCMESIDKNGDYSLFKAFDFQTVTNYNPMYWKTMDERLERHLYHQVYQVKEKLKPDDLVLYDCLTPENPLSKVLAERNWMMQERRIFDVAPFELKQPTACSETALIDTAWEKFIKRPYIKCMLDVHKKHGTDVSRAQEFICTLEISRVAHLYYHGKIQWCEENAKRYREDYLRQIPIFFS